MDRTARQHLVAPFLTGNPTRAGQRMVERRWEGHVSPKPWQRRVTATFAHLETPELVPIVVDLLRGQTADPHVIVVDTGSSWETCQRLEEYRAPEVEIHYVRSHAYRHPSAPVSAACDLAMSLCTSEYLFMTHVDCFLRRRDFLDRLIAQCDAEHPVVGYRMSDRSFLGTNDWRWMVSHTATMLHMPTVRAAGAVWAIEAAHDVYGAVRQSRPGGWPDTETAFNLALRRAGIEPVFLGDETNYERHLDDEVDHCLAGETLVMTREGPQRIADLAGTSPELLVRNVKRLYQGQRDGGRWKRAPIRSFGAQPLMRVALSRGSERREIFATPEHRWFTDARRPVKERRLREVTTATLAPGDRLLSVWPRSYAYSLRRTARAWYVESVEWTDRVEEVFCAVVDDFGCFALADNLLTGNCRSFPGSALYSEQYHNEAKRWIDVAVEEAKVRAERWAVGLPDPPPGEAPDPEEARTLQASFVTSRPAVIREMVVRLPGVKDGTQVLIEQGGAVAPLWTDVSGARMAANPVLARAGEVRVFAARGTYRISYRDKNGRGTGTTVRNG